MSDEEEKGIKEVPAVLMMKDVINSFVVRMDPLKERLTLKYVNKKPFFQKESFIKETIYFI